MKTENGSQKSSRSVDKNNPRDSQTRKDSLPKLEDSEPP